MRIERIDESTIKFFITYQDIEKRGFDKEDLWMNRKRGEEFFWSIMDEVNHEQEEDFSMEGPLWIQVHAYDKGIEVVVSKSQDDKPFSTEQTPMDINNNDVEQFLENIAADSEEVTPITKEPVMVKFDEFEDLIKYTHEVEVDETVYEDLLIAHKGSYYYQIFFDYRMDFMDMERIEAKLLEYSSPAELSSMVVEEYGKVIMSMNVRSKVRKFFKEK
ncbi:adaptor protein MecA [Salinicoccus sp. ID82-1]|uniref:adaptor protein MecA n=1 Tax=Salinicoccus sp. ID82-1 TaxID=2820269 RepID=UPI001F3DE84A|nr:adaptor protein MecA [Salinicoccus sp. ID82-1]MCG1010034.1 adaptor protein MecA [Salinicoccus sp. ID82-1]